MHSVDLHLDFTKATSNQVRLNRTSRVKRAKWGEINYRFICLSQEMLWAQFYKNVPSGSSTTGALGTAHSLFYKIGLREGHQLWLS